MSSFPDLPSRLLGQSPRPNPGPDQLRQLQLRDAPQDVQPGVAQVVAVRLRHRDQRLDRVDVLGLHLGDGGVGGEQGEASEGLHVGVTLQLAGEGEG